MENNKKKSDRTVIKCKVCGYKYYQGDVHKCGGVRASDSSDKSDKQEKTDKAEKPKEKKLTVKTQKDSFKIWSDN